MVVVSFVVVKSCKGTIKKQQQDVLGFLEANKIEFEEKDIAANEENRKWMRENVPEDSRPASGNPLPPRLFNDSRYLGDYNAFFEARENNAVYAFLGLTAPPGSKSMQDGAKQPGSYPDTAGCREAPAFPLGSAGVAESSCCHNKSGHLSQ
uniref:SH3 domain-binding glutamic acid-rich-like protein 1 n=1 Tax=Corvus moneduloides TaxID=1196302 RepID=A0A8C3EHU2_CORMO